MGELADTNSLIMIREKLGRPSSSEVAGCIKHLLPKVKSWAEEKIDGSPAMLDALTSFRHQMHESKGSPPSRLLLALRFVQFNIGLELQDLAVEQISVGEEKAFRFTFDLGMGVISTLQELYIAETEISGKTSDDVERLAKKGVFPETLDLFEQIDYSLSYSGRAQMLAAMLLEDHSGFSILDSHISRLREIRPSKTVVSANYRILGAELARDMYVRVYEMADKAV